MHADLPGPRKIGAIFFPARLWVAIVLLAAFASAGHASAQTVPVPSGNRNIDQPAIPSGALSRTEATGDTFEGKYQRILELLASNKELISKIELAAAKYEIDPIHIAGALVGEHTYNVDALDRLQTYYVKALAYLGSDLTFKHGGQKVVDFVERWQFSRCRSHRDSYDLWACRETVWNTKFRGRTVGSIAWPDDRFGRVFFQPLYAGQTFGLGQLNPLAALRVTDMVVRVSGGKKLSASKAPEVYQAIMDPDISLDYMAAVLRVAIDAYGKIAGFDISGNPGITATLYNLGDVRNRARVLADKNRQLIAEGQAAQLPQENYYGWLVNDRIDDLRGLFNGPKPG